MVQRDLKMNLLSCALWQAEARLETYCECTCTVQTNKNLTQRSGVSINKLARIARRFYEGHSGSNSNLNRIFFSVYVSLPLARIVT